MGLGCNGGNVKEQPSACVGGDCNRKGWEKGSKVEKNSGSKGKKSNHFPTSPFCLRLILF